MGTRSSTPLQTDRGDHPASSTMGNGAFQGVKSSGVVLTTHFHLAPRFNMGIAILILPVSPMAYYEATFTFTFRFTLPSTLATINTTRSMEVCMLFYVHVLSCTYNGLATAHLLSKES
jgi:hypothetical protein